MKKTDLTFLENKPKKSVFKFLTLMGPRLADMLVNEPEKRRGKIPGVQISEEDMRSIFPAYYKNRASSSHIKPLKELLVVETCKSYCHNTGYGYFRTYGIAYNNLFWILDKFGVYPNIKGFLKARNIEFPDALYEYGPDDFRMFWDNKKLRQVFQELVFTYADMSSVLDKKIKDVTYRDSELSVALGLKSRKYDEQGLQSLKKVHKELLYSGKWDIDMESAAYNIMYQHYQNIARPFFKDIHPESPEKLETIEHYIRNKVSFRNHIAKTLGIEVAHAKALITSILFGSTRYNCTTRLRRDGVNERAIRKFKKSELIKRFMDECKKIKEFFVNYYLHDKDENEVKTIMQNYRGKKQYKNALAALIYQNIERQILEHIEDYAILNATKIDLLMHDGVISSEKINIDELSGYIFERTGYKIAFSQKRIGLPEKLKQVDEKEVNVVEDGVSEVDKPEYIYYYICLTDLEDCNEKENYTEETEPTEYQSIPEASGIGFG